MVRDARQTKVRRLLPTLLHAPLPRQACFPQLQDEGVRGRRVREALVRRPRLGLRQGGGRGLLAEAAVLIPTYRAPFHLFGDVKKERTRGNSF